MKHLKLLVLSTLALSAAAHAAPTALSVTATATGYTTPATVQAGYVTLTFKNTGKMPIDVEFFRLKPGASEAQFKTLAAGVAKESPKDASYKLATTVVDAVGGVSDVKPGMTNSATFMLKPGRYILTSLDSDDKTKKMAMSQGYYTYLTVTGPVLSNAPAKADYNINMVDYRFQLPSNVTAGTHTWHVTNSGKEAHFALIAKLLPGKTMDDVMKAMSSSDQSGPPPVDFDNGVLAQVITNGQAEDVTWNLSKGSYVVVCFVEDKRGVPHAAMGMMQELKVK